MTRGHTARGVRQAAVAAAVAALCVFAGWAHGQQRRSEPRQAPRAAAPQQSRPQPQFRQAPQRQFRQQAPQGQFRQAPQGQYRQAPQTQGGTPYRMQQPGQGGAQQFQGRPQVNNVPRTQPAYPGNGGQTNGGPANYPGASFGRQDFNGAQRRAAGGGALAPQGHLEDWLNQHRNVPMQDQERMLRSDPSFRRLPQSDQQRLTQQLRRMDQMPEQQRDRRLARNEMLERLSPDQRQSIARSGQQWTSLSADRQAMMRRAFNDLRGVPLDQRQTVLNSARYQGAFSPEERGILSDFLRVEPYEPVR